MKSLTLHALDDQLAKQIKHRADELSLSMNELAKRLLAESLGIKAQVKGRHRQDFEEFCGKWNKSDIEEFDRRTKDFQTVQPEDWQ